MVMKFCHFAPASILIICKAVKRMIMATATMRTTIWLNPVKNARQLATASEEMAMPVGSVAQNESHPDRNDMKGQPALFK